MNFGHFGSSRKDNKSNGSMFGHGSSSRSSISHSSIHESKHKSNFHSSIHNHKKIHESMHLGKDKIISPFNHKTK